MAGVPDCHPHRFRDTCATNLLEAGQGIRLAHTWLDHEDLSTTALYTKVTDARLAGAVAALPNFPTGGSLPLIRTRFCAWPRTGNPVVA